MFRYVGDDILQLKDVDLFTYLRAVKDIRTQRKYLDLNQMDCPFELRLHYMQPHMENTVLEAGEPVPQRKLLIEWLRTLRLDMKSKDENLILGSATTLTIPCGTIDL